MSTPEDQKETGEIAQDVLRALRRSSRPAIAMAVLSYTVKELAHWLGFSSAETMLSAMLTVERSRRRS